MDNAALVFSGPERFQKLLSLSSEAGKTRRAQFSVPFFVYEGIAMSVTGYGAVNEQRKKAPVQVEQAEEIREIYYKTTYAETETGETIDPKKDIIKYMSIGTKDQNEQRVSPIAHHPALSKSQLSVRCSLRTMRLSRSRI